MGAIIWDWNGTLLNDLELCISTINVLLEKRNLQQLGKTSYKEVFAFPVKDYYEAVGFDFTNEDFSAPAKEFIDLYNENVINCSLHDATISVLSWFQSHGIKQYVLSAMKHDMLVKTLKQQHIFHFFEGVGGLNDHYAVSKIERGNQLIADFNIPRNKTWMIGDTIHDFEVAEELNLKCLLVADGHQSYERLEKTGVRVFKKLENLIQPENQHLFLNQHPY